MSYVLAVVGLLIAAALRLWDLSAIPPGLSQADITNIRLAETLRQGDVTVFYDLGDEGREGLYPAVLALTTTFTDGGVLAYRMLSVWASLITLALLYVLGVRLFGRIAGLAAGGLLGVMMTGLVLSRSVLPEAFLALYVTAVILALARALPVYRRTQSDVSNTVAFTALGVLLGLGFYLHPLSLVVTLASMIFIAYVLLTERPASRLALSYTGFTILLMIIIGIPYLISTINRPDLAAGARLFTGDVGAFNAIGRGLWGIIVQGDASPLMNIDERPLIDLMSALLAVIGLGFTLRYWRLPRFALLIVFSLVLAPGAFLTSNSPDFISMTLMVPLIALFFGIGVNFIWDNVQGAGRIGYAVSLMALLGFNLVWTGHDFFNRWPQDEAVQTAYNGDLGALARYVDHSAETLPTSICYPNWRNPGGGDLSPTQKMLLMMNNAQAPLRFVDCGQGLLFPDGGERSQIILPDTQVMIPAHLRLWLETGETLEGASLPEDRVIVLDVAQRLADAAGVYTTMSPIGYPPEAGGEDSLTAPPVRFGGNITLLGYEPPAFDARYPAGGTVPVITYWRVEGLVPRDLFLFTHILTDPATIAANHDTISVSPRHLRERDVFVQVTHVPLNANLTAGDYLVSVGAYQDQSDTRLPVFDGEQPRGDRVFLYSIRVTTPDSTDE